ncbi:hypothetical protein [uncultured Cellulomonas sp.]|uniref:hypothetical protein n=1 Tax=uncultured Cellulomonas sp. TaxID=189682 RepID=UPI0028E7F36A|nr:hypothetical protein [uncultured Cellulomonas sp.]
MTATGAAVTAISYDCRRDHVIQFQTAQGWLPERKAAQDFLVGTFGATHEQRGILEAFSWVLDLISERGLNITRGASPWAHRPGSSSRGPASTCSSP